MPNAILKSLMIFLLTAQAADKYVRYGTAGSNNGSDWNNAWTNVTSINWSALNAGDSVWIAGSSSPYGLLTVGKSGATNSPIYLSRVRSTNTVPASAAGWDVSFDSTVTIDHMNCFGYNWITLDGQIANGLVIAPSNVVTSHGVDFSSAGSSYISLKNLLITGIATNQTMSGIGDTRCVNLNFNGHPSGFGLYVGYCELRRFPTLISTLNMSQMTVEHCLLRQNYAGNSGNHPNVWQCQGGTNMVFRFNEVTECLAEGIMLDFSGAGDLPNDTWDIYSNLWHDESSGQLSRLLSTQYVQNHNIHFYGNTIVNVYYAIVEEVGGTWDSNCSSKNNIFFMLAPSAGGFGTGADDYNLTSGNATALGSHSITNSSTGVFLDYAAHDYRITYTISSVNPRGKALDLGSPYDVDFIGASRGGSGNWDIGAYQAQSPDPFIRVVSP